MYAMRIRNCEFNRALMVVFLSKCEPQPALVVRTPDRIMEAVNCHWDGPLARDHELRTTLAGESLTFQLLIEKRRPTVITELSHILVK